MLRDPFHRPEESGLRWGLEAAPCMYSLAPTYSNDTMYANEEHCPRMSELSTPVVASGVRPPKHATGMALKHSVRGCEMFA